MSGVEGESACTICRAPIWWRLTIGGRRFPLDQAPVDGGNVTVITTPQGKVRARVLTGPDMPAPEGVDTYRIHECPKTQRPGPRCRGCQQPMPRDLAAAESWTHHPACEPGFARERGRQAAALETGRMRTTHYDTAAGQPPLTQPATAA